MTTQTQKTEIKNLLQNYVSSFDSQKQAAASLENCSESTLIAILNDKWQTVSEQMWINVAKQIGFNARTLKLVETQDFSTLILYYSLAKENGATFAITGKAGFGKTRAAKWYAETHRSRNAYYICCAEYWNKKMFLGTILKAMGKNADGLNVPEMMQEIVYHLRRQHQPVIILDEVDKLSDPVLKFFITLYNELNGMCGFIWQSTDAIKKRITKGMARNVIGYHELFSRIGNRFIELHGTTLAEMQEICEANGITDKVEITRLHNECGGDLRRVDRFFLKDAAKKIRNTLKAAV